MFKVRHDDYVERYTVCSKSDMMIMLKDIQCVQGQTDDHVKRHAVC